MKKKYICPAVQAITISTQVLTASTQTTTLKYGGTNDQDDGPTVAESNSFMGGLLEDDE